MLIVRAQSEPMKAHVRDAQRDLTEALTLLDQNTQASGSTLILGVIEASLKSAKLRLDMVEAALRENGPDATELF
ncbi:MAG TPA: hypothetical protein VF443_04735 [Nitrospira sp.]